MGLPGLPGPPDSRDRFIDEFLSGEPRLCRECGGRYSHPKVVDKSDERIVLRCPLCGAELGRIEGQTLHTLQQILDGLKEGETDP